MLEVLDKHQPVNVCREKIYHAQGSGACERSWGCYGSVDSLRKAEINGYRACENCLFEKVSVGEKLRQIFKR
jgi:hypothetical protein